MSRGGWGKLKAVFLRENAALSGSYDRLSGFYEKRGKRITELKKEIVALGVQIHREKNVSQ